MSKPPYIYTMPEGFLKDQSVPARWRVLGIINGFLMNGKPFYGSNKWLMEQLDCSEQTISNAFKELEALDEIETRRTRRSRLVYRKLKEPTETLTALGLRPETVEVSDPNQLGTISVSNSDSKKSVAKATTPSFSVVSDSPRAHVKKDPAPLKLRETLYDLFAREHGSRPTSNWGDYKRVEAALKHLTEKEVIDLVEDALEGGKPPITVRQALTDRAIDAYRYEHA